MSAKKSLSALRAALAPLGVAAVAAMAPGLAQADAVAQSFLNLSNFRFITTGGVTILNATDSGDVSASINNGAPATATSNLPGGFIGFDLNKAVGPNAGSYVPGSAIVGAPTLNYVGSSSFLNNGDPFVGNVVAKVDNTVSLTPFGVGSAQSNAGLVASFNLDVSTGSTVNVSFNAVAFLRAYLAPFGQPGDAEASYNWSISLTDAGGNTVFSWKPDGLAGGITGGIENADAFSMNENIGINLGGFNVVRDHTAGGFFSATTNALAGGLYSLNIRHSSAADAQMIPEPSVLSLAGLALLGMGYASRRRRAAK